jgi:hypothetical protein
MPASPKKAATLIREVEKELAETAARLEQERDKREQALLADDSNALDALDLTISRLQRAQGRQQERLRLLQQQVEQEEQEAVNKRRQALRERFAKRLAEADADAVELQQTAERMVTLYRKIIDIRETARAAWPIADSSSNAAAGALEGAALSGSAVKALLAFEFYRISADPFLGGVPGERRQQSLPGAVSPRLDQQLMPSAITPFADALRKASAFAVETMGTKLDPLRALNVGEAVAPVDSDARTDKEQKLAALLKQQAELAADVTPEGERRYMENLAAITRLSSEVEQQPGANKQ